jgi:hypothetical protein
MRVDKLPTNLSLPDNLKDRTESALAQQRVAIPQALCNPSEQREDIVHLKSISIPPGDLLRRSADVDGAGTSNGLASTESAIVEDQNVAVL